ncbi:hypothetical protein [Cohnella silvisoli]|uniref:HEAT repeat domain-containing protein n=1 Tax=Cohnella silvisoli TaxID=2873699 RepID=A0ABV1L2A5_9BACL|nr:hypothetical protein [Cohnella silvisoli]MCD9025431.1 hypothetical protein [Cohnella silvisoli]
MEVHQVSLIKQHMSKSITEDELLIGLNLEPSNLSVFVNTTLQNAYSLNDSEAVDLILYLGFVFEVFTEDFVSILCKLLEIEWHYKHEDIARLLQRFKSPYSIDSLFKVATRKLSYLEYNESSALARKCIYALGDINSDESRIKLEILSNSSEDLIKEFALKQLDRRI